MGLEELIRTGLFRVDTVKVRRTAINPMLWLSGLVTPLSFILATIAADRDIAFLLLCFAAVPLLCTFFAYFLFLFRDPDRLQSEEFRIKQQMLQLLYRHGESVAIVDPEQQTVRTEIFLNPSNGGGEK